MSSLVGQGAARKSLDQLFCFPSYGTLSTALCAIEKNGKSLMDSLEVDRVILMLGLHVFKKRFSIETTKEDVTHNIVWAVCQAFQKTPEGACVRLDTSCYQDHIDRITAVALPLFSDLGLYHDDPPKRLRLPSHQELLKEIDTQHRLNQDQLSSLIWWLPRYNFGNNQEYSKDFLALNVYLSARIGLAAANCDHSVEIAEKLAKRFLSLVTEPDAHSNDSGTTDAKSKIDAAAIN